MIIIGSGMSGMLAAHYFRHLEPVILEKQSELPNNHKALLRFRSEVVSDLTGIPFKKVNVQKMISFECAQLKQSNIFLNNMYSLKVTGSLRQRSIGNLEDCERYIAPEDFIGKLSKGLDIKYNQDVSLIGFKIPVISTMPVYALAEKLGYELSVKLESSEIFTTVIDLSVNSDVYQTVYYPSHKSAFYRISITGGKVIAESKFGKSDDVMRKHLLHHLKMDFGIETEANNFKVNYQKYGKLIECEGQQVKQFLGWATRNHNIYSLGRWGTHRQILMDDVVKDIKQIDKLMNSNGYNV
tara:strand:- start:16120 stop:17010 length:891 start_codon:yes stop_codon:yes gene_type:complete